MVESCTWLVQATVRGDTREQLQNACAANNNPCHLIPVIPFSVGMPEPMPEVDGPFIFYGYTTLLLNAFHSPRWCKGVFFDPDVFRPSVYLEKWGAARMLNHDAQFVTTQQFAELKTTLPATLWFVKPDDDLKRFTGGVMTHSEYRDWYAGIVAMDGDGDIGPDTQLLICPPQNIGHEWRVFLLDGQVIGVSCYTNHGRDLALPPELERFARDAANDWSPAPAFALDVTIDEQGTPRLIEANCINGSGLYFADTFALVRALSAWQESNW